MDSASPGIDDNGVDVESAALLSSIGEPFANIDQDLVCITRKSYRSHHKNVFLLNVWYQKYHTSTKRTTLSFVYKRTPRTQANFFLLLTSPGAEHDLKF